MLKMVKGCTVEHPEPLREEYQVDENGLLANVGADKIADVIRHFLSMIKEPIFLILEIPTNEKDETDDGVYHNDVYYVDGCDRDTALRIFSTYGELLINDGLCNFGFGSHVDGDEIMVYEYNIVRIFSRSVGAYSDFYSAHDIPRVEEVKTAWSVISPDSPGMCRSCTVNGIDIYSLINKLEGYGVYFAERRERY